jgi:hypothetical protein
VPNFGGIFKTGMAGPGASAGGNKSVVFNAPKKAAEGAAVAASTEAKEDAGAAAAAETAA